MKIFFSNNCGLLFLSEKYRVAIDFIHRGELVGFSKMKFTLSDFKASSHTCILYTHTHPDHFSESIYKMQNIKYYGPDRSNIESVAIDKSIKILQIPDINIAAINTIHAGKGFENIKHYTYFIEMDGITSLCMGDAALCIKEASVTKDIISGKINYLFVNPLQLLDPIASEYIKIISPEKIVIIHLPLPEEDDLGTYILAQNAQKRLSSTTSEIIVPKCLDYID